MKFLSLITLLVSFNIYAFDLEKYEEPKYEIIPATLSKIVYDSRVGGVRPRPGDPIPTPAYYLTFNVKAQNCVTKKHFKVKVVDLHNEYGIILLKQKVNLNGCMGGPTNWGDEFTGKMHTLTVEGLKQGKPFKMLNSAFVQTTPPRP